MKKDRSRIDLRNGLSSDPDSLVRDAAGGFAQADAHRVSVFSRFEDKARC
jgi:hypothetical protein